MLQALVTVTPVLASSRAEQAAVTPSVGMVTFTGRLTPGKAVSRLLTVDDELPARYLLHDQLSESPCARRSFGEKSNCLTAGAPRRSGPTVECMHRSPALTVAVLVLLTGCGRGTTPTPAPTSAAARGCDTAVAGNVTDRLARPGVENVTVDAACTTVTVATTLSDGDANTARQLCDLAAEVAYTGSVNVIHVIGLSRKDLAKGAKGSPCQSAS